MIFTQEQIDEIEQKLAKRGAKDTQLPSAKTPLTGDESIAIVQERENRLVPIGSIVNTDGGIFNVSEYLKVKTEVDTSVILTLSEALEACPNRVKKAGQIITFIDKDKEWQRYQYQGYNAENWNQLTLWKDLNNISEDMPVSEDAMTFNITEYMPGGSKYKQAIWAGIYTVDGITPVSQYRVIFGCDASLGIVEGVDMDASDTLAIIDMDTDEVAVFSYILFVGNSIDGYRYQTTINSDEDVPDWIAKAFGNNSSYVAANIESLERRVNNKLNNKVDKVQGKGLSTNDFTNANVSELANSVVDAIYNSNTKKLVFTKNNNETIELDATPFIKDGMVNSVSIVDGYLVITFNTDSGKETIRIALTDIFNPEDYYTKAQTDNLLGNKVDKEQGKSLSTNDYTDSDKEKVNSITLPEETYSIYRNQWVLDGDIATNSEGVLKIKANSFLTPTIVDGRLVLTGTNPLYTSSFKVYSPFEGTLKISCYQWDEDYERGWYLELGYLTDYPTKYHYLEPFYQSSDNTDIAIYVKAGWNNIRNDYYRGALTIAGISLQKGILALNSRVTENNLGLMTPELLFDLNHKASKVNNATNGNFAALDSNGNLIDSGHKHSDYLTQHQDLTNYVQKSQTAGLLKNDGTVDTNTYLTQHQDISGKANKNEMSVVPGTGADADKTTITLKQGTSATVLTAHQDISGKENVMPITTTTGTTLSAVVGNYYRLDNVGALAITLPTITGATKLQAITFLLICGPNAVVTFVPQDSETILYQEDFALEDNTTYEVTALWNGSEWTLSRVIYE